MGSHQYLHLVLQFHDSPVALGKNLLKASERLLPATLRPGEALGLAFSEFLEEAAADRVPRE